MSESVTSASATNKSAPKEKSKRKKGKSKKNSAAKRTAKRKAQRVEKTVSVGKRTANNRAGEIASMIRSLPTDQIKAIIKIAEAELSTRKTIAKAFL